MGNKIISANYVSDVINFVKSIADIISLYIDDSEELKSVDINEEIEVIVPSIRHINGDISDGYKFPDFYLNEKICGHKIHIFSDFRPKIYNPDFAPNNSKDISDILKMYEKINICRCKTTNGHDSKIEFAIYYKIGCKEVTKEEQDSYDKIDNSDVVKYLN